MAWAAVGTLKDSLPEVFIVIIVKYYCDSVRFIQCSVEKGRKAMCPGLLSIAVINTTAKKNSGKKRFMSSYSFPLRKAKV